MALARTLYRIVLLWLPNVEWIILIDFASLLFLFLLYPLLCLCTVNSLLPCVSSDNELKFRCGVLQLGSLSFITWNPSTLRFHKKKKTRQQQQQKRIHLNEDDHRSYKYNFYSWEKKAWKKFRLVRDSNPWPLRYRCSALPIKVASITAMTILHLIRHSAVHIYDFHIFKTSFKKALMHFISSTNS